MRDTFSSDSYYEEKNLLLNINGFEGPLDLLLYFIRRDEIDIYDIPISKITYDYLNVIDKMNSFPI